MERLIWEGEEVGNEYFLCGIYVVCFKIFFGKGFYYGGGGSYRFISMGNILKKELYSKINYFV